MLSLFEPAELVNTGVRLVPPHVTMKKDTDSQRGVKLSRDSVMSSMARDRPEVLFDKKLNLLNVTNVIDCN